MDVRTAADRLPRDTHVTPLGPRVVEVMKERGGPMRHHCVGAAPHDLKREALPPRLFGVARSDDVQTRPIALPDAAPDISLNLVRRQPVRDER